MGDAKILPDDIGNRRQHLIESGHDFFDKLSEYMRGKLDSLSIDYYSVEQMNAKVEAWYAAMTEQGRMLITQVEALKEKYEKLLPLLSQIDKIEKSLIGLENSLVQLDEYTLRLEDKFRRLDKEKNITENEY